MLNAAEFYVCYSSFSEFNKDMISSEEFATKEEAEKNALKQNSFRRRLVSTCQQEFQASTSNVRKIISSSTSDS
jgi:hypothetical protein